MAKVYRHYGTGVPNFTVDLTDLRYVGLGKKKVILLFKSQAGLFDIDTSSDDIAFVLYDNLCNAWEHAEELN